MNLWAKTSRQLAVLAVALFFFSCEDETSLIGFKNPRPKFNVSYVEIPLTSSVLAIDSIITDNVATSGINAIGRYTDPVTGNIKAETYLQMTPVSTTKLDATAVYDSVTFQVRLNFYGYGFTGKQDLEFDIHEITGESLKIADKTIVRRYYYNTAVGYSAPIGHAKIAVDYDSLQKQAGLSTGQDTLLLRCKLDNEVGNRLFNLAYNDTDSTFSNYSRFVEAFKGLVITPAGNNGVVGINPISGLSGVILHYHTTDAGAVKDTLVKTFVYSNALYDPNFTNFSVDRSASLLAPITQTYQQHDNDLPPGLRVVQSGTTVVTKLDLAPFYAFADTIDNLVINSSELVISDVQSPDGAEVHGALMMKVLSNNSNYFANAKITAEKESLSPYYIFNDGVHYYVNADGASQATVSAITYSEDDKKLSGFMTLFTQSLFRNRNTDGQVNANRLRYLALHPLNPSAGTSVTRTMFNASNVKLRVYYTIPITDSNPN
jgi:hypothetical protein